MSQVIDKNGSNEKSPANSLYEIVMVALAGVVLLVSGLVFILLVIQRRWNICKFPYSRSTEENAVPIINVNRSAHDNIPTGGVPGPIHISFISERGRTASEIPIGRVQLSKDALLYISLMSMNLPDDASPEQRP